MYLVCYAECEYISYNGGQNYLVMYVAIYEAVDYRGLKHNERRF